MAIPRVYYNVENNLRKFIAVFQHFPKGNSFFQIFVVTVENADKTAVEIVDSEPQAFFLLIRRFWLSELFYSRFS